MVTIVGEDFNPVMGVFIRGDETETQEETRMNWMELQAKGG